MRSVFVVGAVIVVAVSAGCTVRARGGAYAEEPVSTTYVTSAPADNYEAYPHTVYEGRTVYYVHDRWGYPEHDGRWTYYRNEPPPLVRYRTTVREAPPARRYEEPRHEQHRPGTYYEERNYSQPPASAPPAVPVR